MAVYLKKFETQAAYEAAESGLILPNVSLTLDNNAVHYKPSSPAPSHDYVEIGGVKWATMNVGATGVTDVGYYLQWGDTKGYTADQVGDGEGQKEFYSEDCVYYDVNTGQYTKYTEDDGLYILQLSDDIANVSWGSNWRIASPDDYIALSNAVNTAWTEDYQGSGVSGVVLTDKTDSSKTLFFPASGFAQYGSIMQTYQGIYFTNSFYHDESETYYAPVIFDFDFREREISFCDHSADRYTGFPVRAVVNE